MQDTIVPQGLTSMQDLLMFQKEQIKCMCKVICEWDANPMEITKREGTNAGNYALLGTKKSKSQPYCLSSIIHSSSGKCRSDINGHHPRGEY